MKDEDIQAVALKHKLPVVPKGMDTPWAYTDRVLAFGRDLAGEEWPDNLAFPPMPHPPVVHGKLGDLFARFDMQMYAVTFEKRTYAELQSMTRMFHDACSALGLINEALGLDPDDGGADPILAAIEDLKIHPEHAALDSWWVKSLNEFWGSGKMDDDTRRAAKVACTMAAQLHAGPEADRRDAFEAIYPIPNQCIRVGDGYAATAHGAWQAHTFIARWEGFKACALRADPPKSGTWVHCAPSLLNAGVSCANTPRRACACEPESGGHDHFIAHVATPAVECKPSNASLPGWRMRVDGTDAVVEKDGLGGVVCGPNDDSIASAILFELVRDILGTPTKCAARKQGTAGGNMPADCDWPACGCDPKTAKVIDALHDAHQLAMTHAQSDVLRERAAHFSREGFTNKGDDAYAPGTLARAGACYAKYWDAVPGSEEPGGWPWLTAWWKPTTPRRNLVKAVSLLLAEIEKIDRQPIIGAKS